MADADDLRELALKAKEERKEEQNILIGYCYENAEKMSQLLEEENIEHELHYCGIIQDVIQSCYADFDQCVKAAETGIYESEVPETREELPDSANHYIIVVPRGGEDIVVELCSEVRDERFRDIYVDTWPTKDYLPLVDGKLNRHQKFDYD